MNKSVSINISGVLFNIDENGYEVLKKYLESIYNYFSSFDGHEEIIDDIEARITEIFISKLSKGKQVISSKDVDDLIATMGSTADFEVNLGTGETTQDSENPPSGVDHDQMSFGRKKLYRDKKRSMIGGVASGIAYYLRIDPILIRLLFIIFIFTSITIFLYIIMWAFLPGKSDLQDDNIVRKFFRSQKKIIGGVCAGIASYFNTDVVIIRIIFVIALVFWVGLLIYIILWIISPQAKTLTEKMQMKGQPVTISNIEENIKKKGNTEKDENVIAKIILFPFRIIGLVVEAVGKCIKLIASPILQLLKLAIGVFFVLIGFSLVFGLVVSSLLVLGVDFPANFWEIQISGTSINSFFSETYISIFAGFIFILIPFLGLGLLGLRLIIPQRVTSHHVGWSLFGVWICSIIIAAYNIPHIFNDFRAEQCISTTMLYDVTEKSLLLSSPAINKRSNNNFRRDNITIDLRTYEDSVLKMEMTKCARGYDYEDAYENASDVFYKVVQEKNNLMFPTNFSFVKDTKFRLQEVNIIFYIPEGIEFQIDEQLYQMLKYNNDLRDIKAKEAIDHVWYFKDQGINCKDCEYTIPK